MISSCNQANVERNVCPEKRGVKVLIIKRVITKKSRCFNLNDFDHSLKFCFDGSGSYIYTPFYLAHDRNKKV